MAQGVWVYYWSQESKTCVFAGFYLFFKMQRRKESTEKGGHIGGNK